MNKGNEDLSLRLRWAQAVVREAGQEAAQRFYRRNELKIEHKGKQDFVSEADKACEEFVVSALLKAFPEDSVLGEEGGAQNPGSSATWIIDPIDGTANFIAGIPIWCVSLGLVIEGKSTLGIIYNPVTEELYTAQRGKGAFLNARKIKVSDTKYLSQARIGIGFSYRRPVDAHLKAVETCLKSSCEYARFGSGALGMAFTADGRMDGYYEAHINAWDVAAGIVLVEEAGGRTNNFFASPTAMKEGNVILATNSALDSALSSILL